MTLPIDCAPLFRGVRLAKKGEPLFFRHQASSKRSSGGTINRTDPSGQIPNDPSKPVLLSRWGDSAGSNVVVIDDCTTYGVSFGVAAAFLRAAGAASVTGVALGKFGSQLSYYEIDIKSDPFKPVLMSDFKMVKQAALTGLTSSNAQSSLQDLID